MPDYRCPSCRGGFPAAAATDDACPWCGESMDGSDDRPRTPSAVPSPSRQERLDQLKESKLSARRIDDQHEPQLPFWDPGIRCGDHGLGTPDEPDTSASPTPLHELLDRAKDADSPFPSPTDEMDLSDELGQRRMERASDRLDDGGDQ